MPKAKREVKIVVCIKLGVALPARHWQYKKLWLKLFQGVSTDG